MNDHFEFDSDDGSLQGAFWGDEPTRSLRRIDPAPSSADADVTTNLRRRDPGLTAEHRAVRAQPMLARQTPSRQTPSRQTPAQARRQSVPTSPADSRRPGATSPWQDRQASSGRSTGLLDQVDPMVKRIGAMALIAALLAPVAMSLRPDRDATLTSPASVAAPADVATSPTLPVVVDSLAWVPVDQPAGQAGTPAGDSGTSVGDSGTSANNGAAPQVPAAPQATPSDQGGSSAPSSSAATPEPQVGAPVSASTQPVSAVPAPQALTDAQRIAACQKTYKVVAGDYWIRIAKMHSVTLRELLTANNATTRTGLYPGRTVCLPANASPPTTAPPTTKPATPSTTKPPTPSTTKPATPSTTKPPTPSTTKPPVVTNPPPKATYTRAEVIQIIRNEWPDELEEEAIRIATRESNLQPGVRNYCCLGLFQIYWNVHKSWLPWAGVTSEAQLFDPVLNARAAYMLYQRAGGWGPWKL